MMGPGEVVSSPGRGSTSKEGTRMANPSSDPYWRVSPKFWTDTAAWSEDGRTLAIYLLTCQHRTAEGLFVLREAYMAADLGWPWERLQEPLAELLEEGFIEHDQARSVVLIMKALKYQPPANANCVTHALKKLALVPSDSPLTSTFKRLAERFCERLAERLPEGFGEHITHPPALPPTPVHETASRPTVAVAPAEPVDDEPHVDSVLAVAHARGRRLGRSADTWTRAVAKSLEPKRGSITARLATGATPEQVDLELDAPAGNDRPPDPTESTGQAERARMARYAALQCPTCDGTRWTDVEGSAVLCLDCNGTGVATA